MRLNLGVRPSAATLEALLRHQRVHTGVFDYQPDALFRAFPHAARSPLLAELGSGTTAAGAAAPAFRLHTEEPGPARAQLVQEAVVHTLAALPGTQPSAVPAHSKFTDLGLDSLLAVAFTRRVKADLDIAMTPAEVWAHPSPAELATHLDSTLPTGRDTSERPRRRATGGGAPLSGTPPRCDSVGSSVVISGGAMRTDVPALARR